MSACYRAVAPAFRCFVQQLQLPWRKTQRENLVRFGSALIAARGLPVRRAARAITGPCPGVRYEDRRLRRFLGNERLDLDGALGALLAFLLPRFGDLPFVPVMLDWTWVGRSYAVLWAQIPYRGRSFPLLATVHRPSEYHSTVRAVELLQRLQDAWPASAPPPLLLADGGFPKRPILQWLQEQPWHFLIRGLKDQVVQDAGGERVDTTSVAVGEERYWSEVTVLAAAPLPARVVVAGRRVRVHNRTEETRWLLITDLPERFLPQLTTLYAHRMQPEQTHRDCQHGHFVTGFALNHLRRLRADRLERALFCIGFCYAFLVLLAETEREAREWWRRRHWGLSLITFGLDLIDALGTSVAQAIKQALASVALQPLWPQSGDS